jgi:NTP pyrophosphatase (non-canonical NTP hydrolase)
MDFNEYQNQCTKTAIYPGQGTVNGVLYCALGACGEIGEVANKVKKVLRDFNGTLTPGMRAAIIDEIGDGLWYLGQLAAELASDFSSVAEGNVQKTTSRIERGTTKGSGDNR